MRLGHHEESLSFLSKFKQEHIASISSIKYPKKKSHENPSGGKKYSTQTDGRTDGRSDITRIVVTSRLYKRAL
jgi:hypothetical protein